jgi:hypothetical protein
VNVYSFKTTFILAAFLFVFQDCKKDLSAVPATQNAGGISFSLRTTDMQGNTASHFSVGQNFIPTLTISNSGSQNDTLCTCLLINYNPNFLGVYINLLEKDGDSAIFIGKPWNGVLAYFILHHTVIPAHSAYVYAIPWMPDTAKTYGAGELILFPKQQVPPLAAGQYFIQFNFTYDNTLINLKYNFSVQ